MEYIKGFIRQIILGYVYNMMISYFYLAYHTVFYRQLGSVTYSGILFGGDSTNSVEDRDNGDLGGGSPFVRGSGGSCNLVQEISFDIVKFP